MAKCVPNLDDLCGKSQDQESLSEWQKIVEESMKLKTEINIMTTPPKRVRTAFNYYIQDQYRRVARLLDTNVPQAIIKALAEEWRRMRREDKNHYYNREARDRDRYIVARDEWINLHRGKLPKSRRRKKDPKAPKCKRNSFIFYWKIARYHVPHLKPQEQIREIARRWRALSDEDKEEYRLMAQIDSTRYAHESKLYRMQKVEQKNLARIQRLEAENLARQQANQQPPQQEAAPVPQPQVCSGKTVFQPLTIDEEVAC